MALDTILIQREFDDEEDEKRRAGRVIDLIGKALRGEIWLKVGWTASGGQYVSVKDSGPGIPEDELATARAEREGSQQGDCEAASSTRCHAFRLSTGCKGDA